jgi:hypothetical protein
VKSCVGSAARVADDDGLTLGQAEDFVRVAAGVEAGDFVEALVTELGGCWGEKRLKNGEKGICGEIGA